MKKALVLLIMGFLTVSVSAQRIIPKIGMSLYQASVDKKYPEYDKILPKVGLTAGIVYEVPLTGKVSFMPGIFFVQKGFIYKHEHTDNGEGSYELNKFTVKLNYIEIPVLVKVNIGSKFYVTAGPSIGYALSGKRTQGYKYDYGTTHLGFTRTIDVKFKDVPEGHTGDTYEFINNRVDVGIQLGGGVELWNKMIVELRYNVGLTRIYEDRNWIYQFEHAEHAKNRALQLTVGVPISGKK
jgi:hypothetical protein